MKSKNLFATLILSLFFTVSLCAQYKVGDVITDFNLMNVDNKNVSLSQFNSAKGFIVVFTCNSCPVAVKYEQRVENLNKEYRPKAFPVIAINSNDVNSKPDDSFDEMKKRTKKLDSSFPYLYDESQQVAKSFGATHTPHVFVLAKENNTLVVKYIGAIDNNADDAARADKKYVEEAVNSLLEGKEVSVVQTKAIGCSIKWKKS